MISAILGLFQRKPRPPITQIDAATHGVRKAVDVFLDRGLSTSSGDTVTLSVSDLADLLQASYTEGLTDMVDMVERATRSVR